MTSMTGGTGFGGGGMAGPRGAGPGDSIPKGYRKGQLQQFSPEMMNLWQSLFSHTGPDSYLSKLAGGDEETFNQIEAPAMRQFSQLLGGIGSRFSGGSGKGSLGLRRSSGFQNTTTSAASNFAQDLASRRNDLMQNAIKDLFGISDTLLSQKPYENILTPKAKRRSYMEELFQSSVPAFAQGLGEGVGSGGFGSIF